MGWLQRRREQTLAKVIASAEEHLEPDESVKRLAVMNVKWNRKGPQIVVAATDRNVYLLTMHPLKAQVQEVGRKLPLGEVQFEYSPKGGKLTLEEFVLWTSRGGDDEAERLAAYLEERKQAA
jgi:hypothetical protein